MDDMPAGEYVLHVLLLYSWLVRDPADSGLGLKGPSLLVGLLQNMGRRMRIHSSGIFSTAD